MAVLKYKSSDGTWKTIATKGGGGSGEGNNYKENYPLVQQESIGNIRLSPNIYYELITPLPSVFSIWLNDPTNTDIVNEYIVEFFCDTDTTLQVPSSIVWANDNIPIIESGKRYVFSFVNNIGVYSVTQANLGFSAVLNSGSNGQTGIDVYNYIVSRSTTDGVSKNWVAMDSDNILINGLSYTNQRVTHAYVYESYVELSWEGKSTFIFVYLYADGRLEMEDDS